MTAARPRIFIADFDLVGYPGHFFNQVFGFREAARARGLTARIYVSRKAEPEIIGELDAMAILPPMEWLRGDRDGALESFADAQDALAPFWDDLDTERISAQDILVIPSSRPQVIYGISQWLRARPPSMRPAVFFRFLGPEFYDFEAKAFDKVAWIYRFASRVLHRAPGAERVFFTLNNAKALTHLEKLSLRRAFYLPVPKYYGTIANPVGERPMQPLTIYIYVNVRSGKISGRIVDLMDGVLSRYDDVKFLVRFSKDAPGEDDVRAHIGKRLPAHRVEIVPSEQSHIDYLATIERSDVLLLPYGPVEYRGIVSGVFSEIVAIGKIAIIPEDTWMADHITEGRVAGVLFRDNTVADMMAAVEQTIREQGHLQALAARLAPSFRHENSCASNLDRMIELAAQSHDMRLSYVPLTDATKALGSQHHFGEGWSPVDEGFGIWSDGERAEINFSIAPGASSLVFSALVHPFLTEEHSRLDVSLALNGAPVAEWSFDRERTQDRDWSWHHVQLPEHLTSSGEIRIVFSIRSPVSPQELGLSIDRRKLGIALRTLSLGPDRPEPDVPEISKSSKLKQWARHWLKPH